MSADPPEKKTATPDSPGARLEMRGVVIEGQDSTPIDLTLMPGEIAHFELEEITHYQLSKVLLGMEPPVEGKVLLDGQDWQDRSVRLAEIARQEIGRVDDPRQGDCASWIQNLTVVGNVNLAQSLKPHTHADEVAQRADELAKQFGLNGVPTGRPAVTGRRKLAVAQWVRALLPDPLKLLILERPFAQSPSGARDSLVQAIERALDGGTSVVWIGEGIPNDFSPISTLRIEPAAYVH